MNVSVALSRHPAVLVIHGDVSPFAERTPVGGAWRLPEWLLLPSRRFEGLSLVELSSAAVPASTVGDGFGGSTSRLLLWDFLRQR